LVLIAAEVFLSTSGLKPLPVTLVDPLPLPELLELLLGEALLLEPFELEPVLPRVGQSFL
jgi:hypothetical protein